MTVDEIVKLMLAGAIAFAIVLISIGIFKILNNLASSIKDIRGVIKNLVKLSDMSVEDYSNIRKHFTDIIVVFKEFYQNITEPVKLIKMIIKYVNKFRKQDSIE